jgi:hypothetical protein
MQEAGDTKMDWISAEDAEYLHHRQRQHTDDRLTELSQQRSELLEGNKRRNQSELLDQAQKRARADPHVPDCEESALRIDLDNLVATIRKKKGESLNGQLAAKGGSCLGSTALLDSRSRADYVDTAKNTNLHNFLTHLHQTKEKLVVASAKNNGTLRQQQSTAQDVPQVQQPSPSSARSVTPPSLNGWEFFAIGAPDLRSVTTDWTLKLTPLDSDEGSMVISGDAMKAFLREL